MAALSQACRQWRGALALAALERLPAAELAQFQSHLGRCPNCQQVLAELHQTGKLLAKVDPQHLVLGKADARHPLDHAARARGRWRWRVALPGIAVLAAGVAAALLALDSGHPGVDLQLTGNAALVANAQITATTWGSELQLEVPAQPATQVFKVAMRSKDGHTWLVGSYRGTDNPATLRFSCALAPGQVEAVAVTTSKGTVVMEGTRPPGPGPQSPPQ